MGCTDEGPHDRVYVIFCEPACWVLKSMTKLEFGSVLFALFNEMTSDNKLVRETPYSRLRRTNCNCHRVGLKWWAFSFLLTW